LFSRTIWLAAALALAAGAEAHAAFLHRNRTSAIRQASGVSLRKRLHVNDLIAEPGTVEVDFGGLYSYTTDMLTAPSAVKYTPEGDWLLWGRTEYSVSFDSVSSAVNAGSRSTQFSDRLTFAATSVVYDSEHFDIAVAPVVTVFLHGDSGTRVGANIIGRLDKSGNSLGVTASWSYATSPSDTNPSGIWDFGAGYGRQLAQRGVLSRLTPHVNCVAEKATGFERTVSAFAGIEYQANKRFAIDLSGQRYNLVGGTPDRQILLSATWNLGKLQ
jgi:hypothetical protein